MNNTVESYLLDQDREDPDTGRQGSQRLREKFHMTYSPKFRSTRKRPSSVNGIHRRRRKKIY